MLRKYGKTCDRRQRQRYSYADFIKRYKIGFMVSLKETFFTFQTVWLQQC